MTNRHAVHVKLVADTSDYVRGMRKAERAERSLERARQGKMNIGWYWVFGLYGLSAALYILSVVIRATTN